MRAPAICLATILLSACSADDPAAAPQDGGAGGGAASGGEGGSGGSGGEPGLALVWEPCPLLSDGTGPEAECARPELPLRAGELDGPTLPYYVKRYAKEGSERSTQLWMLSGGPGASGIIYEKRAELLAEEDPSIEFYIPDHRGTGDSSRLSCPSAEGDATIWGNFIAPTEWSTCATEVAGIWGDAFDAFTVTNAAHDVGVLVEATRRPGARVFVYGASYGTMWAQRYLQLFPDQSDGVILDAIVPPDGSLARQDLHADESSADLFQACVDDLECGPKLGGDPRAFAIDLYDRLDAGHCAEIQNLGPARVLLRRAFGQMMMTWNARRLIPATLARADRCSADDVAAIGTLFDYYFGPMTPVTELLYREWGWVLSNYVAFSELWETPEVSTEQMEAWRDAAVVSRDVTSGFAAPLEVLPRYEHDVYYGGYADTDTPMLMLQGTWDPATRPLPAQSVHEAYAAPSQHWVEIPRGSHGALGSVPTADGGSCGSLIFFDWLADPADAPDTSCLDDLAPFTFDGTPELVMLLFGTDDAWGGI
jgi:pimeloyl-ACP methyl ester carboxylesterase